MVQKRNRPSFLAFQFEDLNSLGFKESLMPIFQEFARKYKKKTLTSADSPYSVQVSDYFLRVDASGGNITLNLPTCSDLQGLDFIIKRIDSSANTVTLAGNGSDTIDSATSQILKQWDALHIFCDGVSAWDVV